MHTEHKCVNDRVKALKGANLKFQFNLRVVIQKWRLLQIVYSTEIKKWKLKTKNFWQFFLHFFIRRNTLFWHFTRIKCQVHCYPEPWIAKIHMFYGWHYSRLILFDKCSSFAKTGGGRLFDMVHIGKISSDLKVAYHQGVLPSLWNNLNKMLKTSNSLNTFKHNIKQHITLF